MRTEIVTCDNCKEPFDPAFGVGALKASFTDPSNPIVIGTGTKMVKPNVENIRKDELCPKCAHMIMTIVRQSLQSENGKE